MSTLQVTNIKATGETASRAVSGVAAAWVNFNGTGTVAIRDSMNVSSLTDNGTGNVDVNLTNSFANDDYCAASMCGTVNVQSGFVSDLGNKTTGFFGVTPRTSGGSAYDFIRVSTTIHGDLA